MKPKQFIDAIPPGTIGVGSGAGGDLGGTLPAPTVVGIGGVPVDAPDGDASHFLDGAGHWVAPATGAPTTVDYLVGTASGGLSAEIVVGTTPGGELGGTWASPTVDATHAGSTHIALGTATPLVESGAGSAGTAAAASKEDHVHPAASVVTTLAALTDVSLSGLANLDALRYSSADGKWHNSPGAWRPLMDGLGNGVVDGATGEAIVAFS